MLRYIVFDCERLFFQLQIVTKQSRSLTLNLHNKNGRGGLKNLGTLTVHAEETMASKSVVEIKFRCSHLENKDIFSKSVCIMKLTVSGYFYLRILFILVILIFYFLTSLL